MQISDIFYHHQKHGYDELHHLKVFYRKPEEILSFLILDENPNFPPKFIKNLHIQKKKKKKKIKVQIFLFIYFLFYLTCFTTVPIFKSIGPLVAEIWGGGGGQNGPPPPMDSSPQNNPLGLGLKCIFPPKLFFDMWKRWILVVHCTNI